MSDRFVITQTPIRGVCVLQRKPREDERGWIERIYDRDDLASMVGSRPIAQVNRSVTLAEGTVRGLHYQVNPSAEAKIVSCLRGSIFDVAVDVRRDSPTFLRWHGEVLSAENRRSLFLPEGVAHGYQALVDDCELLYVHTAPYDQGSECGIHPSDPLVTVAWPRTVRHLSPRDAAFPFIGPDFRGVEA